MYEEEAEFILEFDDIIQQCNEDEEQKELDNITQYSQRTYLKNILNYDLKNILPSSTSLLNFDRINKYNISTNENLIRNFIDSNYIPKGLTLLINGILFTKCLHQTDEGLAR